MQDYTFTNPYGNKLYELDIRTLYEMNKNIKRSDLGNFLPKNYIDYKSLGK